MEIAGHRIAEGERTFVIAEAGVNHNGDLQIARRLVAAAADAGADAIKFQTFKAEAVASDAAPKAGYQLETTSASQSHVEMLRELELSPEAHEILQRQATERGIVFMSSPFDRESVDLLDRLGLPAYKIPSGEITNLPFLRYIGQKQKPVILSTGMSYLKEVESAVEALKDEGCEEIALLQCVSNYPADPADINLRAMRTMGEAFRLPVGYSDHTVGNEVSFAAVAMGACIVEKHFTLDQQMTGPDHRASIEPLAFKALVDGIRAVEMAIGDGRKAPAESEANTRSVARRSLVTTRPIERGAAIAQSDLTALRPGTGISPSEEASVVGMKAARDLPSGTVLSMDDLS